MNLAAAPFDATGFATWQNHAQSNYAASKVASGAWPEDGAQERARSEYAALLPEGAATPGHHVRQVFEEVTGKAIGMFWVGPATGAPPDTGWLFDIEIHPTHRGQGLGRQVMTLAEKSARELGYARLGLHVFGDNTAARRLYESCGYELTDICMSKTLGSP